MTREEIWVRAYCSVASAFNSKEADCARYADGCLKAFDERFPPSRHETQWRGIPISQLTDEQRAEMLRHYNRVVEGASA